MNKNYYTFELFDSRNTCTTESIIANQNSRNWKTAINRAKRLSKKYYKVVVRLGDRFSEIRKGEVVSWSA